MKHWLARNQATVDRARSLHEIRSFSHRLGHKATGADLSVILNDLRPILRGGQSMTLRRLAELTGHGHKLISRALANAGAVKTKGLMQVNQWSLPDV